MRILGLIFTLCLLSSSAFARFNWEGASWEKIKVEDGISVYGKAFPDSNVKGVGGAALIDASVEKIIWVLMDHEHKSQWVDRIMMSKTVEEPTPLQSIQYATFGMPFPMSDRDFLYSYAFTYDKSQHMIEVDVKSVVHSSQPESATIGVRGDIIRGKFRLYPQKGQKKTYVEVEYLADPKGYLPSWVVNLVQKNWPYKTLKGLQTQVKKDFVTAHQIPKILDVPQL